MTFGEKIKLARISVMLSQQEIACELGVSYETVNRWENNKSKPNYKAQRAFNEFCKKNNIEL